MPCSAMSLAQWLHFHCRIGSLEIHSFTLTVSAHVHCRIGSLGKSISATVPRNGPVALLFVCGGGVGVGGGENVVPRLIGGVVLVFRERSADRVLGRKPWQTGGGA